jgi:hypothetical protein
VSAGALHFQIDRNFPDFLGKIFNWVQLALLVRPLSSRLGDLPNVSWRDLLNRHGFGLQTRVYWVSAATGDEFQDVFSGTLTEKI